MTTSITRSIRNLLLAAATTAAVSGMTPAWAQEPAPSVTVKYADLNISTTAGAETLYRRIQHAAKQVCQYEYIAPLPDIVRICYEKALANAVAKVNSAPLQAVYLRKSGTARS